MQYKTRRTNHFELGQESMVIPFGLIGKITVLVQFGIYAEGVR